MFLLLIVLWLMLLAKSAEANQISQDIKPESEARVPERSHRSFFYKEYMGGFISPDIAKISVPSRSKPRFPIVGLNTAIREISVLRRNLIRSLEMERIYFETSSGRRSAHKVSHDGYDIFWRPMRASSLAPNFFSVYINFKTEPPLEKEVFDWWQEFLEIELFNWKYIEVNVYLEKMEQFLLSREWKSRWQAIHPELPSGYAEALKHDVNRIISPFFLPWVRNAIIESFERIHDPANDIYFEEKVYFIDSGPWIGFIWKIYISPFFIVGLTDGSRYDLVSPDMARLNLRQFYQ